MFGSKNNKRKDSDVGTTTTGTYTEKKRRPSLNYLLASLLTLAGSILLWLAAFSTPFIKSIYYVGLRSGNADRLGTFGYCVRRGLVSCRRTVGYNYPLIPGNPVGLTGSLILTAIAAGLGSLAFFGLLFALLRRKGGFPSFVLSFLAGFLALISFILAVIAFVTFHKRASRQNQDPEYGSALWLHLVGTILLLAAIPLVLLGWIRQRRHKHDHDEVYAAPAPVRQPSPVYVAPAPVREPSPVQEVVTETYVTPVTNQQQYTTTEQYVPATQQQQYAPPTQAYPEEVREETTAYRTPANEAVFGGKPHTDRYVSNYSGNGVTTNANTYQNNNQGSYRGDSRY